MARVVLPHGNPIPLTLTLSHGEREQSAPVSVVRGVGRLDPALGSAEEQWMDSPSPEGEGRGEGKGGLALVWWFFLRPYLNTFSPWRSGR